MQEKDMAVSNKDLESSKKEIERELNKIRQLETPITGQVSGALGVSQGHSLFGTYKEWDLVNIKRVVYKVKKLVDLEQ